MYGEGEAVEKVIKTEESIMKHLCDLRFAKKRKRLFLGVTEKVI